MLRFVFYSILGACLVAVVGVLITLWYMFPRLPAIDSLKDVQLQVPLRVYSRDGRLIGEFGEQRRTPVALAAVPPRLIQAFLDTEDQRFYEHVGVDPQAVIRAALNLARTRQKSQGASTITMQVAREYFLSREKTYRRKFDEMLLALKIERELDKSEILELYLNTIFLGQRAHGVAAAAQVYYGKELAELTLPEMAMIAGLPQAPSRLNPVSNPPAALERRSYVLRRMLKEGHISVEEFAAAQKAPETARVHGMDAELDAPYVAELARTELLNRYGTQAYTAGLRAYTTIDSRLQQAANRALRKALLDYDRRHGYRGPETRIPERARGTESDWQHALAPYAPIADLIPALVIAVDASTASVYSVGHGRITLPLAALRWVRYVDASTRAGPPANPGEIVAVGDVVRLEWYTPPAPAPAAAAGAPAPAPEPPYWRLSQIPQVAGALVSLSADDGAIHALVGGLDFGQSKFNRVTQAKRQPGSAFKPFIYSAALESGYTPASFVNDAPIVFDAPGLESAWRPENYTGRYYGPTRLREALAQSRNLVSIRLLRSIGVERVVRHAASFGFDAERLPRNLSLSLGTGELTPLELARGFAVFANGGYLIEPHIVTRVENERGVEVWSAKPPTVCRGCDLALAQPAAPEVEPETIEELQAATVPARAPGDAPRAISAENAWLLSSMLRDVIRSGTGARARELKRDDLAGKTGTTNDQNDAWFAGFNSHIVTTAWVGFDQLQTLGKDETGARAALPMWIDYMRTALDGAPEAVLEQPPGLVTVRIDPATGGLASAGNPRAIYETFRADKVPRGSSDAGGYGGSPSPVTESAGSEGQLF